MKGKEVNEMNEEEGSGMPYLFSLASPSLPISCRV